MKFTLITLVLCMFVLAALTEAGKAGKNKKKGQNNKGVRDYQVLLAD